MRTKFWSGDLKNRAFWTTELDYIELSLKRTVSACELRETGTGQVHVTEWCEQDAGRDLRLPPLLN